MCNINKFVTFVIVLLMVAKFSSSSPVSQKSDGSTEGNNDVTRPQQQYVIHEEELVQKLNAKCSVQDVSSCVMLKLVTYMNKLMKKNSLEIGEMMEISKKDGAKPEDLTVTDDVVHVNSARGYSDESAFGEVMADKLWKYVQSRSLKIRVLPEADFVVSASPEQDGSLNFGMSFRSGKDLESGENNFII